MAQKRMFDKAIIETDNFLKISLSAKALYFLLGMEADDEGFVSPNRVMRLYGGEIGDLKNLIDTKLIIPFESGVVVITDWNQNNWLDSRRTKPTQYQKEKKSLLLTENGKYLLSNGSARGEERSIEENDDFETKSSLKGSPQTPKTTELVDLDSEGNPRPKKNSQGKSGVNLLKLQNLFMERRRKEFGISPSPAKKNLAMLSFAMNSMGLKEEQIPDLIDYWFSRGDKREDQLINMTQMLSAASIDNYKLTNNIID